MLCPEKNLLLAALILMGSFGLAGAEKEKAQTAANQGQPIRVDVEMVSLPVVATTKDDKRVIDLQQRDFRVYEDGVEQEIAGFAATDEPVSIALMLDTSGSTEQKLARIQNEAIRFVNLLHPDDRAAIMSFADDVNLLKDFSIDREKNAYGIKETRPGGSTVLYEAVWLALNEVIKPIKERKAVVIFTDGVDTASRKASEKETIEQAKETQATIYAVYYNTEDDLSMTGRRSPGPTIGGYPVPGGPPIVIGSQPPVLGNPSPGGGSARYDYMAGRKYLQDLANYSGGKVFDALEMKDLSAAFEEIAKELSSEYSIGYYSKNSKQDGRFRTVSVKVERPGVVARTRKGYYARK
jgi:VWFA-related protein